tara:strand:- start:2093 stop:3196 length:1104 start_codon:yes stop_codon:yes gene_type:complete
MKHLAFFSLFLFVACTSTKPQTSWPEKMQELTKSMESSIPYFFNDKDFYNKNNREVIITKVKKLRAATHHIPEKEAEKILGEDPMVRQSLQRLQSSIDNALEAYVGGNLKYSQSLLQNAVSYCYNCHTSNNLGPKNRLEAPNLMSIKDPIHRAKALVATRQYDKAKETLQSYIFHKEDDNFKKEQAIKTYLAIAVKTDHDKKDALHLVEKYKRQKQVKAPLKESLQAWQKSLMQWTSKRYLSLSQAKEVVEKKQKQITDSSYVDYLLASKTLHAAAMGKDPARKADSYYHLGIIYDHYPDFSLWGLADNYYQTCIELQPKTSIARKCYKNLEESVFLGFSGSAGTFIPESERLRLKLLRAKAGVKED